MRARWCAALFALACLPALAADRLPALRARAQEVTVSGLSSPAIAAKHPTRSSSACRDAGVSPPEDSRKPSLLRARPPARAADRRRGRQAASAKSARTSALSSLQRNCLIGAIWSSLISAGTWPTPSNSTDTVSGLRSRISFNVLAGSTSDFGAAQHQRGTLEACPRCSRDRRRAARWGRSASRCRCCRGTFADRRVIAQHVSPSLPGPRCGPRGASTARRERSERRADLAYIRLDLLQIGEAQAPRDRALHPNERAPGMNAPTSFSTRRGSARCAWRRETSRSGRPWRFPTQSIIGGGGRRAGARARCRPQAPSPAPASPPRRQVGENAYSDCCPASRCRRVRRHPAHHAAVHGERLGEEVEIAAVARKTVTQTTTCGLS